MNNIIDSLKTLNQELQKLDPIVQSESATVPFILNSTIVPLFDVSVCVSPQMK